MEKLVSLSREIDAEELFPLVQSFVEAATGNKQLEQAYQDISGAKQSSKRLHLANFFAALCEAIAMYNNFSSLDQNTRKEMLQGCRDSTQFYLNRILKEAKEGREDKKIEWAKELETILKTSDGGHGSDNLAAKPASNLVSQTPKEAAPRQPPTVSKPPKTELVGNIWHVEHHEGNKEIEVNIAEMQQRVVISNCAESVIQIRGKCTAISVEQARKVQLNAACPTVTIDNCEGIQVFLATGVEQKLELLTCKSNEVNLYRQDGVSGYYSDEIPVPEQFKSVFDTDGKLRTEPVRHTGA